MQLTSYHLFECLLLYINCTLCNVTQFGNINIYDLSIIVVATSSMPEQQQQQL